MIEIVAPNDSTNIPLSVPTLFLGGGISGCSNWQKEMIEMLQGESLFVLNPRRENFPIHIPEAAYEQIKWEFEGLESSNFIMFWFASETLCPIVLLELGKWMTSDKQIFIGIHPDYARRQDVEIQVSLERPQLEIKYSLEELAKQIKTYLRDSYMNSKWIISEVVAHHFWRVAYDYQCGNKILLAINRNNISDVREYYYDDNLADFALGDSFVTVEITKGCTEHSITNMLCDQLGYEHMTEEEYVKLFAQPIRSIDYPLDHSAAKMMWIPPKQFRDGD